MMALCYADTPVTGRTDDLVDSAVMLIGVSVVGHLDRMLLRMIFFPESRI